ncbi:MAG TPA: hypothetical protein VJV75_04290 [Candidatus Polarisedimenticolia bacterium]|nr:hypothetical protein [Candidatus Polarisedimenticolia bacterium]
MRTHRRRIIPALAVAALLLAGATGAGASTFLKQNVSDLIRSSQGVVHARVTEVRAEWNADHTFIFSYVTLEVKRTLAGTKRAYETVRVPGGVVDGYRVVMEGAPSFEVGDNVVVFIGAWDDGALMVEGYYQGMSKVDRDAAGNEMLKGGSAHGLSMAQLAKQIAASGK